MRRGLQGVAVAAVLCALAWLLLPVRPGPEAPSAAPTGAAVPSHVPVRSWARPTAPTASASTEDLLEIRGTVWGPRGPVSGARVQASSVVQGESLSTLPCGEIASRMLLECPFGEMKSEIRQWVAERRGEAILRAEARTAADGSFTLSGLEPGSYAVWVESAEGAAFRPSVFAGAEPLDLRLGPLRRVSGQVTTEDKVPVAGALVTAIFASHSRFFETLTDAEGRYQLGPFPPGTLVAVVAKQGLTTTVDMVGTYTPEVTRDFVLLQPQQLIGKVLRANTPVPGVEVRLSGEEEPRTVLTDAAGRFAFVELTPASYTVSVELSGEGASVWVQQGELLGGAELLLELTPITFVEGVVRDEDQKPLPGAEISALWDSAPDETGDTGEFLGSSYAVTDEAGHYRLGPLTPGRYILSARLATHQESASESREYAGQGMTQDFTLPRGWEVVGVLVDPRNHPVQGERLSLKALDHSSAWDTGVTDEEGRFTLYVPKQGEYELSAEGDRIKPLRRAVTVPSEPLRIVAEPLLQVVGEVVDETGTPLPGAEVGIWPEQANPADRLLDSDEADGEGRFTLRIPTAGRYVVAAELFSHTFVRMASQTVVVETEREAQVQLRFTEGHRFTGRVVDWRGQPLPGVPVLLQPAPRPVLRRGGALRDLSVKTDAEGRFSLQQVSGEEFDACIRGEIYTPLPPLQANPRCIRVKNDGQEARLVLGRQVFVTGRLVHPDGTPVTRFRANGREIQRDDGEISILIHQPGQERIELSAPGLQPVLRTAPEFPEGVSIQDLGTLVMSP